VKTLLLFLPLVVYAQSDAGLPQGRALFRGNCAFCHGLTAEGGRGPNLVSAPLHHGEADADLKGVIRNGVPGTTMPAFSELAADDLDNLLLYLHSLSRGAGKRKTVPGDPQQGRAVYAKNGCPACHRIGDEGSVYGPDLTRIGSSRSIEYLRESIVNPSADIQPEYEGVTAVTRDGRRMVGVRINEDTFTLQLRTSAQNFVSFSKDDLREVTYEKKSLMPAYNRLSPADLENLVAYLAGQQGPATGAVKESEEKR
jgi:cytochrome c oxidase cbb3-type subunit III